MKIAWIGTGVMGQSMAGHLLAAGHGMCVYSRTREKARALLKRGAAWAESPDKAANGAEIICTMVGYPKDVEEIYLGERGEVAAKHRNSYEKDGSWE